MDNLTIIVPEFRSYVINKIKEKALTPNDKEWSINFLTSEALFPISGFLEIPKELKKYFFNNYDVPRYSIIYYSELLENIKEYLDDTTDYPDFLEEWQSLPPEEVLNNVINILFNFMLDNKIIGFSFDY